MALQTDPETIMLYLGYNDPTDYPQPEYGRLPTASISLASQVDGIMRSLAAIDTALEQARLDSMAETVDKLKVNYGKHIGILKSEGSRLLGQLSHITKLPLVYDKYRQTLTRYSPGTYSVANYW